MTLSEMNVAMTEALLRGDQELRDHIYEGHCIVSIPEFEFSFGDKPEKYFNHSLEDRRLRRQYFRTRQNGRKRMAVPMTKIVAALKDHDADMAAYEEKKRTRWESMLTNENKLFLLDPENQDF